MALVFMDGFEEYNSSVAIADFTSNYLNNGYGWNYLDNTASISSTVVRTNAGSTGRSLSQASGVALFGLAIPSNTEIITGFGYYVVYDAVLVIAYFSGAPGTTSNGLRLQWNIDGSLSVKNSSTSAIIATSAPGVIPQGAWQYIECRYKFGAAGDFQVRVNGVDVFNLTGIDTRGAATSFQGVTLATYGSGSKKMYFDDFYVCDTTGSSNNTFLGPVGVYTLTPSADASVQMTPSTAGSNYSMVDEIPNDSSTTYVSATAASLTDFYDVTDLPAALNPSSIAGVQVNSRSQRPSGNAAALQLGVKSGGISSFGSTKTLAISSWITNFSIFEKKPDNNSWDKASVDAMNVGILSV